MSNENGSFQVGIEFRSILSAISKQIYETPLAFLRENVQNAVDATRIQAYREEISPTEDKFQINVDVQGNIITVRDCGSGMSKKDLESYFWTIGASGKRTDEATAAGCVGMFGIGGFANFGVCNKLEVISQTENESNGTLTHLSESDIEETKAIPSVKFESSNAAAPRGTLVVGHLRESPNISALETYIKDFVKYVPIPVNFNGQRVSQHPFTDPETRENLTAISELKFWSQGNLSIKGQLFEDRGHTISASIEEAKLGDEEINLTGYIRFQNGSIDAFKRGFKLCATTIGSTIGVSGRLDCDQFVPTAGRDSLESNTTALLSQIALFLETIAVQEVLKSTDRINQHTRIFRLIVRQNLIDKLGEVKVNLADGTESTLGSIQRKSQSGVRVFYGVAQKQALNQIMQARGHVVVLMSSDHFRREAEQRYLQQFCSALPFDGMIDCVEHYEQLNRFEKVFLSELELNVSKSYLITHFDQSLLYCI